MWQGLGPCTLVAILLKNCVYDIVSHLTIIFSLNLVKSSTFPELQPTQKKRLDMDPRSEIEYIDWIKDLYLAVSDSNIFNWLILLIIYNSYIEYNLP